MLVAYIPNNFRQPTVVTNRAVRDDALKAHMDKPRTSITFEDVDDPSHIKVYYGHIAIGDILLDTTAIEPGDYSYHELRDYEERQVVYPSNLRSEYSTIEPDHESFMASCKAGDMYRKDGELRTVDRSGVDELDLYVQGMYERVVVRGVKLPEDIQPAAVRMNYKNQSHTYCLVVSEDGRLCVSDIEDNTLWSNMFSRYRILDRVVDMTEFKAAGVDYDTVYVLEGDTLYSTNLLTGGEFVTEHVVDASPLVFDKGVKKRVKHAV